MSQEKDLLFDLLKKVAALRRAPSTSRAKFPAQESPYKPVLLLMVLRRIQQGRDPYCRNIIQFEKCEEDFSLLYTGLYGRGRPVEPKVVQAFWYLGAGKPTIWELIPQSGQDAALLTSISAKRQIKTRGQLQKIVSCAHFRDPDWKLISDPDVQSALISFIMNEHFSDVGRALTRL